MLPRMIQKQQLRQNGVRFISPGCRMDSEDSKSTISDDAQSTTSTVSRPVFDDDDSKSVKSTISLARSKEVCPCCDKELQARAMFNHMRKLHPDFLKGLYCVWTDEKMDELIKAIAPMPIEWKIIDDFDDEEDRILWGCLACNNTFTTEQTAQKHCKLAKCKAEHIKELKRIKKEEQQERAKKNSKVSKERQRWINRTPSQIHLCIQQDVVFYNKKFENLSTKIIEYLQTINRKYNNAKYYEIYDCDKYVFKPIPLPAFENNKDTMENIEHIIDREIINYHSICKDALSIFYSHFQIVSDGEYTSLEQNIYGNHVDLQY